MDRNYKLLIEPREGYLRVSVSAEAIDLHAILAYGDEIGKAVASTGLTNVLLIPNYPFLPRGEARTSALFLRNALRIPARLAIVHGKEAADGERREFAHIFQQAGLDANVFTDEAAAREWLIGSDHSDNKPA